MSDAYKSWLLWKCKKKGKQIKYLDERSCKRLHLEKLFEIDIIFITVII